MMGPMQAESKRKAPGRDPRCCCGDGVVGQAGLRWFPIRWEIGMGDGGRGG